MAVIKTPIGSTIRLSLVTGTNAQGAPIIKQTSISNVKAAAADQDLFDVANAIVGLQDYALNSITRLDSADLAAQA